MIKVVLFDLDDTLLGNPTNAFVKAYLRQLIDYLHQVYAHLPETEIRHALAYSIQALTTNLDPTKSNQQVFWEDFTSRLEIDPDDLHHYVSVFYAQHYPALKTLTTLRPAAATLVEWLLNNEYAVAIATNPLFPADAINQRLAWAGVDASQVWFVSTMENTHFTKPQPHYFEEILTRIGFEADEALMVGNDWELDIAPAHKVGLNTFWITASPDESRLSDGQGSLDDLLQRITTSQWLDTLQPRPLSSAQIAPRMLGNVAALLGMVDEFPNEFWTQRPDPNEWSPLEIVVHLYNSERNVQRTRLQRILDEDNPFLVAPPTPPDPGTLNLDGIDGLVYAHLFAAERIKTLQLLDNLSDNDWTRPARHSVFGPTSLLEMAAFTTRHDRLHINQLCQTVGKCE